MTPAQQARAARRDVEAALGRDVRAWPWSCRISLWLDALLALEEST